jgi:hypothetical protein
MAMRRTLAILKYVPAVLCGLLVVAWVVSLFFALGLRVPLNGSSSVLTFCRFGGLNCWNQTQTSPVFILERPSKYESNPRHWIFGELYDHSYYPFFVIGVPIPLLLTALIPLSIGPFTGFRFPLWSYFAWTALIAAELAYYLR